MAPAPGQHPRAPGDDATRRRLVAVAVKHPQLQVVETKLGPAKEVDGATLREYRVYNWERFPSGRVRRGDGGVFAWLVLCSGVALLVAILLGWRTNHLPNGLEVKIALSGLVLLLLCLQSRSVLYQSITPLPGLGIQLSTTRGFSIPRPGGRSLLPVSTSRTFVPLDEVSSLVVNEALSGWEMRHYLALIRRKGAGIEVVFDVSQTTGINILLVGRLKGQNLRQPGSLLIHIRERVLADLYS